MKAILLCLASWHRKFQTIHGMMGSGTLTLLNPLVEILSNNGSFETSSAKEVLWSNNPYFIPSPQAEKKTFLNSFMHNKVRRTAHYTDQARGCIRLRTILDNVAKRTNTTPSINLNMVFMDFILCKSEPDIPNLQHYTLLIQNNNIYSVSHKTSRFTSKGQKEHQQGRYIIHNKSKYNLISIIGW